MSEPVRWTVFGLQMDVSGYERPDDDEYWDANWLSVQALLEAPGAYVEARGPFLRTDEIQAFAEQLEALDSGAAQAAKLVCLEPNLGVVVRKQGGLGALKVEIDLTHDAASQTHHFKLDSDLSFVPAIVRGARRVLSAFPVKGTPDVR